MRPELSLFAYAFVALLISFCFTLLVSPAAIRKLREMKFGQEVRSDGPETHLKKQGTPTMGGVIFFASTLIATALVCIRAGADREMLCTLLLMSGFGALGLADDWLKIRRHNTDGLSPKKKLALQFAVCVLFLVLYYAGNEKAGCLTVPFTGLAGAKVLRLPVFLFVPFSLFAVLGTDNGVNFTDGLDGLCSSLTAAAAVFFVVYGLVTGSRIAVASAALIGGLLGFLLSNVYPAKIFMGDAGSLALGGFVAGAAVSTGLTLYIPLFGFIYLLEVLSVIIQVTYFKKTGGKRIFLMAPIHHHFEKLGNSETRIVCAFTVVTILLTLLSILGILL